MAATGRWSNVGDWLLNCLLNVRRARVLVRYGGSQHRSAFIRELTGAFSRFAALPSATRNGIGFDAIDAQSSLRKSLVERGCLVLSSSPDATTALVLPADRAKKEPPQCLIIGIAMTDGFGTLSDYFSRICDFDPNAAACPLPALPAPPPRPIAIDLDEKGRDSGVETLDRISDEEEDEEEEEKMEMDVSEDAKAMGDDDESGTLAAFFSKCPICLEIPFPPWQTTTCGHLICTECHAKLQNRTSCPTCRQTCATTLVPQLLFAEVAKANAVKLRCRYEACGRRIPWDMARAHHDTCSHRDGECCVQTLVPTAPKCPWRGPLGSVAQHFVTDHGAVERTDDTLSLAKGDEARVVAWTTRQVLVKMAAPRDIQHFLTRQLCLRIETLRPHGTSTWVRIVATTGVEAYKMSCTVQMKSGLVHYFPVPKIDAPWTISLAREHDNGAIKKRPLVPADEDGDAPSAKEARVEEKPEA
jgi:Zinc finger, C3HC4 type (RING finger)